MHLSKFMNGSPILLGDSTVPGLQLPEELRKLIPDIIKACKDFGLEFYPIVVQKLTYDEISEVASYQGFPVRFPHWKWGMEYAELQKGYEHGRHRIYEMVVNTCPAYIYCLDSNDLVDDVTVIAHAIGHTDFFTNNIFFSPTSGNMMNQLANNGTRIRRYIARWGKEKVTEFIDDVLKISTLIDPAKAWSQKKVKDVIVEDKRKYADPLRLPVKEGHEYMDSWINTESWKKKQDRKAKELEVAKELDLFEDTTKDIMGYLKDHAELKPWQQDILAMLYDEAMYFVPQRTTHMMNEGWASYVDFNIIAKQGYASLGQESHDMGIVSYATHKMGVLGGKYSMNPYKLGYCLFSDIEERWNKGRFGDEYDACTNMQERENWDQNLGLGQEKVLEVRKYYNDVAILSEFFTPDFCNKYEFFEWKQYPNGEYKIEDRNPEKIKQKLMKRHINGGLPDIRLADPNHKSKGFLFLEHQWDGRVLHAPYATSTMAAIYKIWGKDVLLSTKNASGEELVLHCYGPDDDFVEISSREKYEAHL